MYTCTVYIYIYYTYSAYWSTNNSPESSRIAENTLTLVSRPRSVRSSPIGRWIAVDRQIDQQLPWPEGTGFTAENLRTSRRALTIHEATLAVRLVNRSKREERREREREMDPWTMDASHCCERRRSITWTDGKLFGALFRLLKIDIKLRISNEIYSDRCCKRAVPVPMSRLLLSESLPHSLRRSFAPSRWSIPRTFARTTRATKRENDATIYIWYFVSLALSRRGWFDISSARRGTAAAVA